MVQVMDVTKQFKSKVVLDKVSLHLQRGRIHGIVGRNGSGKTVLMKCICGFLIPDEGRILVDGKEIGKEIDFPEHTGVIIETPGFVNYQSGYVNLKNLAFIKDVIGEKEIRETLQAVGLDDTSKLAVGKYSMGMRQRLGIAQAIMEDPELLVLDEPMNGLDNQGVEDMRRLFLELKKQGKTMLLASHNKEDIDVLCDEVYQMDSGVIERLR